ncbi:MAG: DUF2125 domain-containing protein [Pseudomonadota bacterium]
MIKFKLEKLKKFWETFKGKPLKFGGIFLGVSFLVYIVIWNTISHLIGSRIVDKIDEMRSKGVDIALTDHNMSGFPNNFIINFEKPIYRNSDRTFGWTTSGLVITPLVFEDRTVHIDFPDDQYFSFRNFGEEKPRKMILRSDNLRIATSFRETVPSPIHISSQNLLLQIFRKSATIRMGTLTAKIYDDETLVDNRIEDMIAAEINIFNLGLTEFWRGVLENDFTQLTAHIYMRNPGTLKDFGRLRFFAMRGFDPPEIIIDRAKLFHRLSDITMTGLLTIDDEMRFNGNLDVTISDYRKALAFLEKKGVIARNFTQQLRNIFSFLVATDPTPNVSSSVTIKLSIKKNMVYKGNIPIAKLPGI